MPMKRIRTVVLIKINMHSKIMYTTTTIPYSSYFDIICDLLLNRCTATWNLLVSNH